MQCPTIEFHFNLKCKKGGDDTKKTSMNYDIYHQFCPGCHRLFIGVYEYLDTIPAPMEKDGRRT